MLGLNIRLLSFLQFVLCSFCSCTRSVWSLRLACHFGSSDSPRTSQEEKETAFTRLLILHFLKRKNIVKPCPERKKNENKAEASTSQNFGSLSRATTSQSPSHSGRKQKLWNSAVHRRSRGLLQASSRLPLLEELIHQPETLLPPTKKAHSN